MKKLLKKNILVLLVSLLLTGTFGVANARSVEADVLDQTSTLVYNDDLSGRRISDALYDGANYYGPRSSDSHIWFGDISNYNSNNGYHGDAFWRVVDRDESYNGTKGMMWLTSEFTFTPVQDEHGGLETTFRLLFSDVEKAAMTTEGHEADEDFKYYEPHWYGSTAKVELDEEHKLFSLSAKELQKQFSTHLPTYVGSSSKTNAESAAYAAKKRERTLDLREDAEEYWMRQSGYYYAWDWITEKTSKMEGRGNVSNELGVWDLALNINRGRCGTRPSFTLDLSKVLFMSPAKDADGVKSNDPGFKTVESFERNTTYGENWKLTLLDENRTLNVDSAVYTDAAKNYVKISYNNATVGDNDYISAFVVNDNNEVKYFGRVLTFNKSSNNKGEFILDLSNINTSKSDRIFLFSEKANGDYLTDYASMPVQVEIELKQDFPVVTFEKGNDQAIGDLQTIELTSMEAKITLPDCKYVMPEGSSLAFIGWKRSGRSTRFLPGEKIKVVEDMTFTAEWGKSWAGLQEQINKAASGSTITLDDDYFAGPDDVWLTVPTGKTITIDLNGHKLDRALVSSKGVTDMDTDAEEKGGVFYVSGEGTKLIINDSSNGNGKIMGGCAAGYEDEMVAAGVTAANKAVVEFNNGNITGNHGAIVGAVAAYNGGTFIMNGGKITQNNGMMAGAAFVYRDGTFTMNGGEITTNVCVGLGTSGIYDLEGGTVNLNGGKIHSNTGVANGGIIVSDENATLNISGSPIVENNYTSSGGYLTDVVLGDGALITVTDELNKDARIKVMSLQKPALRKNIRITDGLIGNGDLGTFICSDPNYIVVTPTEGYEGIHGEAYLAVNVVMRFFAAEGDTQEIEEIRMYTAPDQYIENMPECTEVVVGKTFDHWTVKEQREGTGSLDVEPNKSMYVNIQYIKEDNNGSYFIEVYGNWLDHDHNYQLVEEVPATCYAEGVKEHYICVDDEERSFTGCEKIFLKNEDGSYKEVSEEELVIPMKEHDYGEPTYTWAEDYSTVTAVKVCKNKGCSEEIEGHTVEERVYQKEKTAIKSATCEEGGVMQYVSEYFYTNGFKKQTVTVDTEPLGHNWDEGKVTQELTCTQDGITVYTCRNDESHTRMETVEAPGHTQGEEIRENEVKPTCTQGGSYDRIIKCTVCDEILSQQHITIPAPGHDWEDWTEINNELGHFMIRECKRCHEVIRVDIPNAQCTHGEKKEVKEVPATCTKDGVKAHYQCKSCAAAFVKEDGHDVLITKENYNEKLKIAALGHAYGEVRYEWAQDGSSVTATRVCAHDETHIETETANVSVETTPSTCSKEGRILKTASFSNEAFTKQETETVIPIDKDAHKWSDWTVKKEATCEEAGKETRVCEYNEKHTQTREIAATGHAWTLPVYEWSEDFSSVTGSRVCLNDEKHEQSETTSNVTSKTTDATCTTEGTVEYTAVFENKIFETQVRTMRTGIDKDGHAWSEWTLNKEATCTKAGGERRVCANDPEHHVETRQIPAIGHKWSEPEYTWTSDNSSVTARRVCANDPSHVEEETAYTTSSITKFPTTEDAGEIVFTAKFVNPGFSVQTKTEEILPVGKEIIVTFDTNGGDLDDDSKTVNNGSRYGELPEPAKENRVFEGWYTSPDFKEGTQVDDSSIVEIPRNHKLYARYQIPVTFNDSDNRTLAVRYVYEDQPTGITAPSKKPGKEGYTFMCWADASGQEYDFTQPVTKPVTLKPKFFQYRYIGNENIWYLGNVGVSTFTFKRYEFMISERVPDSDKVLGDNFKENGEKAYVDGCTLDTSSFTYANGSLILNLKDSYLNKLSAGRHTLRVDFTDGTAMADFTVIERIRPVTPTYIPPKTGN